MRTKITQLILALVVICTTGSNALAQTTVYEASTQMNAKVKSGNFLTEVNQLPADDKLKTLDTPTVTVCALLRGDNYHTYYKDRDSVSLGAFLWVFEPVDTKARFNAVKSLKTIKRFRQFLGLDDVTDRDTIVYLEVERKDIFRPAYVTDPTKRIVPAKAGAPYTLDTSDAVIRRWFFDQLITNTYPWTRMGYTYDWGNNVLTPRIGATEFVIRKDAKCKMAGFKTFNIFMQ